MRKKSEFTTVERAIHTIDGFHKVSGTLLQQTILRGQSQSTLDINIRQVYFRIPALPGWEEYIQKSAKSSKNE